MACCRNCLGLPMLIKGTASPGEAATDNAGQSLAEMHIMRVPGKASIREAIMRVCAQMSGSQV